MRTRLLAIVAALLFALPAVAERWGGGNSIKPGVARSYTWTTGSIPDSDELIASSCGLIQYVWDRDILGAGTTAAATLRACADAETPAGQCTDVALSVDATDTITSATPVISVVGITAAGAGEQARVTIRCQEAFSSSSGSGAPTDADYLVGSANGSLSDEIVVGTTPGGELGGTWPSPTIDSAVIDADNMANADHGDVAWSSSVATVENLQCTTCVNLATEVSGTLPHENGGLEADISAYSGLVAVAAGATSEVDTSAEVAAQVSDETGSGAMVFGTSPTLTTPDVGAATADSLAWNTTQTECIMLEGAGTTCKNTTGCAINLLNGTNFDYNVATFADGADDEGTWSFIAPPNLAGTTLVANYYWYTGTCTASNDDVCFTVAGAGVANDEAWVTATLGTAVGAMDTCATANDLYISPDITITHGIAANDKALIHITRDVDAGIAGCADDNISNDVQLLGLRVCYEVNDVSSGE